MPRFLTGPSLAVFMVVVSTPAYALTLTNRDSTEHTVTIIDDQLAHIVTIGPRETVDDLCAKGCTIAVGEGESMAFEGSETVLIVGGVLTIDE